MRFTIKSTQFCFQNEKSLISETVEFYVSFLLSRIWYVDACMRIVMYSNECLTWAPSCTAVNVWIRERWGSRRRACDWFHVCVHVLVRLCVCFTFGSRAVRVKTSARLTYLRCHVRAVTPYLIRPTPFSSNPHPFFFGASSNELPRNASLLAVRKKIRLYLWERHSFNQFVFPNLLKLKWYGTFGI